MGYLEQLKAQASEVQARQQAQQQSEAVDVRHIELASQTIWLYLKDLAQQLNVLQPPAPALSLDGRSHWPTMKLADFRTDIRKKNLRGAELVDYIAIGWRMIPQEGKVVQAKVEVNFPPELERVEKRLGFGSIKHERNEIRDPATRALRAIQFIHALEARGSVNITADHDKGSFHFRLANTNGFEIRNISYRSNAISKKLLDELAKTILGQPSTFG